jgi:hypothetical protein
MVLDKLDGRLRLNGSVSDNLRHFARWCANCGIIMRQAQQETIRPSRLIERAAFFILGNERWLSAGANQPSPHFPHDAIDLK